MNRLATEASPYLVQHAHNPVDWWPWCPEALAEARRRDVPILLSIGYSACHWCHVMERESFENEAIARLMNDAFVNVKVDREERPDLDQMYQLVVQLMGRTGGWPLTVFLTPSQKPFFAGTYFPPEDRYGMPGFPKVVTALADAYRTRRQEIEGQAGEITQALVDVARVARTDGPAPGDDVLERAASILMRRFDEKRGGFPSGQGPSFPNTMPLEVLLRHGASAGDARALAAVRLQLDAMRRGGIHDQLGGGFHRYSTDPDWLVPHFEKMLYDNAVLLRAYVDGFRVFGEPAFAETARGIAGWVAREMTDPDGGFYASQDADSEGEEGKFFLFTPSDVAEALVGDDEARDAALAHFGITLAGNFEEHGRPTFRTVLHEAVPRERFDRAVLDRARERLFAFRERRERPFRDDKVLTSWTSLMISALADAGSALAEDAFIGSAERALAFVRDKLVVNGRAMRLARNSVVKGPGFLDDHAYLANAALDVYEATGEPAHVELAQSITDAMLGAFDGPEGFYFTPSDGETLLLRAQDPWDNAVPSGASMACRALLRLGALLDPRYARRAEEELARLAPNALANPLGFGQTICELDRARRSVEVVLVGPRRDPRMRALASVVHRAYIPNRTLAWIDPSDPASVRAAAALAEGKGRGPAAYVCRGRTCSLPVTDPEALRTLI
jgi:uncharacterized protein